MCRIKICSTDVVIHKTHNWYYFSRKLRLPNIYCLASAFIATLLAITCHPNSILVVIAKSFLGPLGTFCVLVVTICRTKKKSLLDYYGLNSCFTLIGSFEGHIATKPLPSFRANSANVANLPQTRQLRGQFTSIHAGFFLHSPTAAHRLQFALL